MGMSASQARLLSITSRMNDIELRSQQISNTKIRLADESEQVANKYTKALNASKLTKMEYSKEQSRKVDLTINELSKAGSNLRLKRTDGKTIVPKSVYQNYKNSLSYNNNKDSFCGKLPTEEARKKEAGYTFVLQMTTGEMSWAGAYDKTGTQKTGLYGPNDPYRDFINAGVISQSEIDYYTQMFNDMFDASTTASDGQTKSFDGAFAFDDSIANDPNWLYEAIESGQFILEEKKDDSWKETSVSGNVSLGIESYSENLAKAEAEYNASTAKINTKEKKLDQQMKEMDTEHSALKTEYDSVKSLISDNISKSFQLFS